MDLVNKALFGFYFLFLCCPLSAALLANVSDTKNNSRMPFENVFKSYNRNERPYLGEAHVPIEISMYILGFSNLNYETSELTSDFFFRQIWTDPRLENSNGHNDLRFTYRDGIVEKIWIPDTFFVNGKHSYIHNTPTPTVFLKIAPNGTVMYSVKTTLTSYCFMDLHWFPRDIQYCDINVASYGFLTGDVFYKWKEGSTSVGFSPNINLPGYSLIGHKLVSEVKNVSSGEYSQVKLQLTFARNYYVYIFQFYLPLLLMVILSWFAFWMEPTAYEIRLTMGVSALVCSMILTLIAVIQFPNVGYMKSVDIYMITGWGFTLMALIENIVACYSARQAKSPSDKLVSDEFPLHEPSITNSSRTDKVSRFLYPIFFGLFNVAYWYSF